MADIDARNPQGSQGEGMRALTVARLAEVKKIPMSELTALGLADVPGRGVAIPYYDLLGKEILRKTRTAVAARDGSVWPQGKPLEAYGQWKLGDARNSQAGFLIVVEGESDCWALWHHRLPALGLPGSGAAKTLNAEHLLGIRTLYLHREPDLGGTTFVQGLLRRLQELNFAGRVFQLQLLDGVKDPADQHVRQPDRFLELMQQALVSSKPLSIHTFGPRPAMPRGGEFCNDERPWQNELAIWRARKLSEPAKSEPAKSGEPREESQERVATCRSSALDDPHGSAALSDPFMAISPVATCVAKVPKRKIEWLWPGRIPLGKLSILDGDPGLGKSSLTLDLAARVSRGDAMAFETGASVPAGDVLLLSAEDDAGDTVRPRLERAGADLTRVHVWEEVAGPLGLRPVTLPGDLAMLEELIVSRGICLVVIDPLMAFLGEQVNSNNDQRVRRALLPLAKLAEATRCAILVVRHLNKQVAGKNPLYRGGGSIGIIGAARSALLVTRDPDDPEQRLLAVSKSNLSPRPTTLRFRIAGPEEDHLLVWAGPSHHQADDLLGIEPGQASRASSKASPLLDEAQAFLRDFLRDGPVLVSNVYEEAERMGIARITLKRAKELLGIEASPHRFQKGEHKRWVWRQPDAQAA